LAYGKKDRKLAKVLICKIISMLYNSIGRDRKLDLCYAGLIETEIEIIRIDGGMTRQMIFIKCR